MMTITVHVAEMVRTKCGFVAQLGLSDEPPAHDSVHAPSTAKMTPWSSTVGVTVCGGAAVGLSGAATGVAPTSVLSGGGTVPME